MFTITLWRSGPPGLWRYRASKTPRNWSCLRQLGPSKWPFRKTVQVHLGYLRLGYLFETSPRSEEGISARGRPLHTTGTGAFELAGAARSPQARVRI